MIIPRNKAKRKRNKEKIMVNPTLQIHKVISKKFQIIKSKIKIVLLHRNLANVLMNNKMKRKKIQAIPVAVLKVNLKIKNKMLVKIMMIILKNKTKRKRNKGKIMVNPTLQIHKAISKKVQIIKSKIKIVLLHPNLVSKQTNSKMKNQKKKYQKLKMIKKTTKGKMILTRKKQQLKINKTEKKILIKIITNQMMTLTILMI